ncbi:MAG: IPT/TIG domain-containing protein [Chloroflexota bacterium]|nr:IPT/TIG domain-containing protein [Chloroflexota bacterium]
MRVTVGGQTSVTGAADQFTYIAAPTITALSPTSGSTAGGTLVTITGTGFSTTPGATTVAFGAAATGVSCSTTTSCTATSPAHAAGTVDVRVTVGAQTSATSVADQFTYLGSGVGDGTYEDSNVAVSYSGSWLPYSNAGYSGGTIHYTPYTGATASLTFTSTAVTLVYGKDSDAGNITVTIDGSVVDTVDGYAASTAFQGQKSYSVAAGTHTITIGPSGTKNGGSSGTYLYFDAFVVGP